MYVVTLNTATLEKVQNYLDLNTKFFSIYLFIFNHAETTDAGYIQFLRRREWGKKIFFLLSSQLSGYLCGSSYPPPLQSRNKKKKFFLLILCKKKFPEKKCKIFPVFNFQGFKCE